MHNWSLLGAQMWVCSDLKHIAVFKMPPPPHWHHLPPFRLCVRMKRCKDGVPICNAGPKGVKPKPQMQDMKFEPMHNQFHRFALGCKR